MTCDELVESCLARLKLLDERAESACRDMDSERFNGPIPPSNWSPAQILDHMVKVNAPYLDALDGAIPQAPAGSGERVQHSWLGSFLLKAASPKSNAPAPRNLHPGPGPFDRSILDTYLLQSNRLAGYIERARGRDLNRSRINNPFLRVFRMTLADVFAVSVEHAERHIGQIEASLKG